MVDEIKTVWIDYPIFFEPISDPTMNLVTTGDPLYPRPKAYEGLLGIKRFSSGANALWVQVNKNHPSADCFDGIDNDGDGYTDVGGGIDGYLPDAKCSALNQPSELGLVYTLRSSVRVGPQGGDLILGDVKLHIPKGALQQELEITIERIPAKAPNRLSYLDNYRFYPENLRFLNAVVGSYRVRKNDPDLEDDDRKQPLTAF